MAGLVVYKQEMARPALSGKLTLALDVHRLKAWIHEQRKRPGCRMSMSSLFEQMGYSRSYMSHICEDVRSENYLIEISARFIAQFCSMMESYGEQSPMAYFIRVPASMHVMHPQDTYRTYRSGSSVRVNSKACEVVRVDFGNHW